MIKNFELISYAHNENTRTSRYCLKNKHTTININIYNSYKNMFYRVFIRKKIHVIVIIAKILKKQFQINI